MEKESSESKSQSESPHNSDDEPSDSQQVVNLIKQVNFRKWYSNVTIFVQNFEFNTVALFDSGADLNCIQEGLIPTKFYQKSSESLSIASGKSLQLNFELPKAHVDYDGVISTYLGEKENVELERGVPRLVINYKPLNSVLEWIRYKTAFVTPFGHYEWNVMLFGLKNAPSEFQNIMNEIFNPYNHFSIVYIDDVLIFSESIEQHWKHLHKFLQIVKQNGLVVSAKKIKLFQTNIRFLGFNICQSQISPIDRVIQFADKFPDQILDKSQLQRFLGSLNYVSDFYKNLRKQCKPLFDRLQSNPPPWSTIHTEVVKQIKTHVKTLPCLGIPSVDSFKIVETDASDIGYGGILKQRACPNPPEQIVRFHSVGQIRPSYQSTLISSYDPFSVDPSAGPSVAFKKTSPYLPKSNFHLFVVEHVYDINSDPVAIARHYFPLGFHYMPPSPYKSFKYYRDILLETQSVEIKPIKDRDHP
ncbi:unnamed protein product [Prunus armeniaca]